MADAVSETFKYWTRYFRIFCSPNLLVQCGFDRDGLARDFGIIVRDKYKSQLDLGFDDRSS